MAILGFNPFNKTATGKKSTKTTKATAKKAVKKKLDDKKKSGGCEFC